MHDEIRVHVVNYGKHRKSLYMRYKDPMTGKHVTRSTGTRRRKEAERKAAVWEAELREGRYKPASKVTWAEFRERYEDEALTGCKDSTFLKASGVFNALEEILNPSRPHQITGERISFLVRKLRERKLTETTIKSHLAHIRALLNWGKRVGILHEVPRFQMPRRARGEKAMKGRPVTLEEFERMLAKVPDAVIPKPPKRKKPPKRPPKPPTEEQLRQKAERDAVIVESWRHLLRGLWLSGLRLGEALDLHWTDESKLCVDLSGRRPMLRIRAEAEKGHKDRILPVSPEFAEFLLATPDDRRQGFVFNPLQARGKQRPRLDTVSSMICRIGKRAGVKVADNGNGKTKNASAHDLRRSFGFRWASRVMPAILQQIMRHESIETTMRYYVGQNAEAAADVLWEAAEKAGSGNTLGNTADSDLNSTVSESTEVSEKAGVKK